MSRKDKQRQTNARGEQNIKIKLSVFSTLLTVELPNGRPSKCHQLYTAIIPGEKEFTPKSA